MGYSGNTFPSINTYAIPYTDAVRGMEWSRGAEQYTSVKYFIINQNDDGTWQTDADNLAFEIFADVPDQNFRYAETTSVPITPGDVLLYDSASGNHIAIVQDVVYEADGITILPDKVFLIESAGGVDGKKPKHVVMKRQTWENYQSYGEVEGRRWTIHISRLRYR